MTRLRLPLVLATAVAVALALTMTACGSSSSTSAPASSSSTSPSTTTRTTPQPAGRAVTASGLEHAILFNGAPPRPVSAVCRAATAAERAAAPFGRTQEPEFSCLLALNGERARYDVQVQSNGCFVAERHRPGRAVYGCGVRRR